jgi:hypothetical protein
MGNAILIRFLEEEKVIPLYEIESFDLRWFLYDPVAERKYWFLVLTLRLRTDEEESAPIAVATFNCDEDERELREEIRNKIVHVLDLARSRCAA